ncbi:MAG TPA: hypothetical protein VEB21_07890 [Terriglobales bacterium]|nr:hypothetical protein [Terriglobales bacterium]
MKAHWLAVLIAAALLAGGCSTSRWRAPWQEDPAPPPTRVHKASQKRRPAARRPAKTATPTAVETSPGGSATATPTPPPAARLQPELGAQQSVRLESEARAALASAESLLRQVEPDDSGPGRDRIAIVRGLVQQARAAANAGDWQRAHTMAKKAQVIGKDLAR